MMLYMTQLKQIWEKVKGRSLLKDDYVNITSRLVFFGLWFVQFIFSVSNVLVFWFHYVPFGSPQ